MDKDSRVNFQPQQFVFGVKSWVSNGKELPQPRASIWAELYTRPAFPVSAIQMKKRFCRMFDKPIQVLLILCAVHLRRPLLKFVIASDGVINLSAGSFT
jgi:hypothetical protein